MPAIRVHHTATSDARWDGPANEARLDSKETSLRAACAWVDAKGNVDAQGSYKFVHHEVDDAGKVGVANIRACVSGIAALNGARGGTSIPDADREGVYRHLAAHIKDSGATPPELKTMNKSTGTKRLDLQLEIKSMGEDGTFTGDLSVYDFVDYGGDVTVKGCFTKTLQESGGKVPMLYQHDMARPIGVMELADGDHALAVMGHLNMELPDAQVARSTMRFNMKHGIKTGLSMGYITIKDAVQSGIRYLQEVKLLEGSVVTLAANRLCAVTEVKAAGAIADADRKSFAEELEEIQVYSLSYQIMQALFSELYDCCYQAETQPEAEAAARQAFTDAQNSYLDYIARYFAMQASDPGEMEVMQFPEMKVAQKMVADLETRIKALQTKAHATAPAAGAAPNDGAATTEGEPGMPHSTTLTDAERKAIRDAIKEA